LRRGIRTYAKSDAGGTKSWGAEKYMSGNISSIPGAVGKRGRSIFSADPAPSGRRRKLRYCKRLRLGGGGSLRCRSPSIQCILIIFSGKFRFCCDASRRSLLLLVVHCSLPGAACPAAGCGPRIKKAHTNNGMGWSLTPRYCLGGLAVFGGVPYASGSGLAEKIACKTSPARSSPPTTATISTTVISLANAPHFSPDL